MSNAETASDGLQFPDLTPLQGDEGVSLDVAPKFPSFLTHDSAFHGISRQGAQQIRRRQASRHAPFEPGAARGRPARGARAPRVARANLAVLTPRPAINISSPPERLAS